MTKSNGDCIYLLRHQMILQGFMINNSEIIQLTYKSFHEWNLHSYIIYVCLMIKGFFTVNGNII